MQKKTFEFDISVDPGKREVVSIISTDAIDRDGEVVLPSGLKKKNYAGNPVVLVNHNYESLPIGKSLWIKTAGDKVLAKTYITDKTQLGQDVFGLLQDGILNAVSIGFVPSKSGAPTEKEIKARPELAAAKNMIREWELLEYSFVTVPCNPEALTLAVSKGYSAETLKFINGGTLPEVDRGEKFTGVNFQDLPDPIYCKEWKTIQADIDRICKQMRADNLFDRYRGRI